MKNKYFGNSLDYFEKNTTDEKYISGNNLELYKADDPLSARTLNRPLRQLIEDTESSYQIIQNIFKTLYGQTDDETEKDIRIIPDIYEEMSASGLVVGRFNQDTANWFLRIPTGAFTARISDSLANVYKYTFNEDNQYSRDFYIANDRNAAVVFNRPNIELFERQIASHFNISLNDQNNDVKIFVEGYTDGTTSVTDDIEKSRQLSERNQKIRYYAEIDNTTYNYKDGITVGTETVRIPQEQNEYCNNIFSLTNSIFNYFKSYLTNSDDYYSLEEVIDISNCDGTKYTVYYNPTLETINDYSYSKTNRFVLIKSDVVIDSDYADKIIKLYDVTFSKQPDALNDNRFIISDRKSYLTKIDRTTLSIKNINLTNAINNIVLERKNNNYNISNAHLPLGIAAEIKNNIAIGTNTLGYPQIDSHDKDPTLFDQAFKTNLGADNIAIGFEAMMNTTDSPVRNIAIGYNALKNINNGSNNIEITTNGKTNITSPDNLINIGDNLANASPKTFGSKNIIFGKDNLTNVEQVGESNLICGINNNIYKLGDGNIILSKDASFTKNNTLLSYIGDNNVIIGNKFNTINPSIYCNDSVVIGSGNRMDSNLNSVYIYGQNNTSLTGTVASSYILGIGNTANTTNYSFVIGYNNINSSSNNSYVLGESNNAKGNYNYSIGKNIITGNNNNGFYIGSYINGSGNAIKIGGYTTDQNEIYVINSANSVNIGPLNGIYTDDKTTTTWAIQATNNKAVTDYAGSLPVFTPNFVVNANVIQVNNKYLELKQTATFNYGWEEVLGGNLVSDYFANKTAAILNTGVFPGTNIYSDGISLSSSNIEKNKNGSIIKQNSDNLALSTHSTGNTFNPIYFEQYRFYVNNEEDGKSKITLLSDTGDYSQLYNIYPNTKNTYSIGKSDSLWENVFTRNINLRTSTTYNLNTAENETTTQYNGVLSLSDVADLGFSASTATNNKKLLIDNDTLKNWDGAYTINSQKESGKDSNLKYCNNGFILGTYGNQIIGQKTGTAVSTIFMPTDLDTTAADANKKMTKISIDTDGNASISTGKLAVYSGMNLSGDTELGGDVHITDKLNVDGYVTLSSGLSVENDIDVVGDIRANSFEATSARKYKKDIVPTKHSAVDEINKIDIVDFYFKTDENNKNPKVGFIADDTDSIFSTPNKDSMDLYNCVGMLLKAVQELSKENKELKAKVNSIQESK